MLTFHRFEDVSHILSCRETVLSSLSQQSYLRDILGVGAPETRLVEVQTSLLTSQLNRAHGALQEGLKSATYLASLIEPCRSLGINIEASAHLEAADALWEQGEMASSIGMLQLLEQNSALSKQHIPIGKSDLLAKIGYQVSVARLEKPDRIIEKYLTPALKELKGKAKGNEAGQVFHEFAVFCDQQLQDLDTMEDLDRLRTLKEMKESEVRDLKKMSSSATTVIEKQKYHSHLIKAKQWLKLDEEEYRRLSSSNAELLRQSLENYLLSLTASDDHNNDALRFTALWLQNSELDIANNSVTKYLHDVPSRKFATLMNQLTSRLLDNSAQFQQLLFSLVLKICKDHPYHGMYQIYSGSNTKSNNKDETAMSRLSATRKVGAKLSTHTKSAKVWSAISSTSKLYCQLAAESNESKFRAGQKIMLKNSLAGTSLSSMLPRFPIPPPTMQVDIAVDLDYSHVPTMSKLEPQISIASGVSAPKIITVIANNGAKYKQLVS
jgi:ataxia telangiectasia mutated family protein